MSVSLKDENDLSLGTKMTYFLVGPNFVPIILIFSNNFDGRRSLSNAAGQTNRMLSIGAKSERH